MICIGFAGIESFDTILYTGRTLTKLDYRVLIVDLSGTGAIAKAIKLGMDIDAREEMIHYRGIDYMQRTPNSEELKAYSDEIVFVVHGFHYISEIPLKYNQFIVTVNTLPSKIDQIHALVTSIANAECKITVLIRNIISLDDIDRVMQGIPLPQKMMSIQYLYLDTDDLQNAVECQIKKVIRFTGISSGMRKYIIHTIKDMLSHENTSKIKRAVKSAERGG